MELLTETVEELIIESVIDEETKIKKWNVFGPCMTSNVINKNGRCYPSEVLDEALRLHKENFLDKNNSLGQLNHPSVNQSEIDFKEVSHKFLTIEKSGNDYIAKAMILDTPCGKIAQNLLEAGVRLHFSSRGLGNLIESNGKKIVSDYTLITPADLVHQPSAENCILDGIMEKQEYIYENGVIVKKDLSEEIDEYRKIINESKRSERVEAAKQVVSSYIKNLLS